MKIATFNINDIRKRLGNLTAWLDAAGGGRVMQRPTQAGVDGVEHDGHCALPRRSYDWGCRPIAK